MESPKLKVYTEAEALKKRLSMSHTERFDLLMKLIRINKIMKSAKIIQENK